MCWDHVGLLVGTHSFPNDIERQLARKGLWKLSQAATVLGSATDSLVRTAMDLRVSRGET